MVLSLRGIALATAALQVAAANRAARAGSQESVRITTPPAGRRRPKSAQDRQTDKV